MTRHGHHHHHHGHHHHGHHHHSSSIGFSVGLGGPSISFSSGPSVCVTPAPVTYVAPPPPVYIAPPPPVYVAPPPPVYSQPIYPPQPTYVAPQPVYPQPAYPPRSVYPSIPPPPAGFVIPAYTPGMYSYQQPYYRHQPFIIPYGLAPHLAAKMMQASAIFRMFDTNCSGNLCKKEWKRALRHMHYHVPKGYGKYLFHSVDRDHSGRISEREFCEWWLATNPY